MAGVDAQFDLGVLPWPLTDGLYAELTKHLMPDLHVIYTDHFYEPYEFTHQRICLPGYPTETVAYPSMRPASNRQAIALRLHGKGAFAASTGVPFYVGEFSASQFAPPNDAGEPSQVAWLRDVVDSLEAEQLSWSYFSYDTYYSWNPLLSPGTDPCGPYHFAASTPTSLLVIDALKKNAGP